MEIKNMRVKELIKELQKYNPEAEITLTTSETIFLSFICENKETEQNTRQVFIEGCDYSDVQ